MRRLIRLIAFPLITLAAAHASLAKTVSTTKVVHVFVALCDNLHQGIVPVPSHLGNGQSPRTNLYWGALYGVKTFFKSAEGWDLVSSRQNPRDGVLERCVFVSPNRGVVVVADAYDGRNIRRTVEDFLSSSAGKFADSVLVDSTVIPCGGRAQLLAYVGHNGLMDCSLDKYPKAQDSICRRTIILACASKPLFREAIRSAGACPLLWTTGLMAPEAYTLLAAVETWAAGQPDDSVRTSAASAYSHYQKCSLRSARALLVTGW